jgi:hypothetical protein
VPLDLDHPHVRLLLTGNTLTTYNQGVSESANPVKNFEALWNVFNERYAFFDVRGVDWQKQKEIYRPQVSDGTTPDQLFEIMSKMIEPLDDGHVELKAKDLKKYFCPENRPRFWQEFEDGQIEELFTITASNLQTHGFSEVEPTQTKILLYAKSDDLAYLRIVELEGQEWKSFRSALTDLENDFADLKGYIIDLRECPGGDDEVLLEILGRFVDMKRVAFHRREKLAFDQYSELETWYVEPKGASQFTGPVVLLTNDTVFSGGDVFAMVARDLPNVTIVGDHTNGIFSYQFDGKLPNGWTYCLSNQIYYSENMICYESKGIPVDIEVMNTRDDLAAKVDVVLIKALSILEAR